MARNLSCSITEHTRHPWTLLYTTGYAYATKSQSTAQFYSMQRKLYIKHQWITSIGVPGDSTFGLTEN